MTVSMVRGVLTTYTNDTYTELLQAGAGKTLIVRMLNIHNTTGEAITVSVEIADSTGSPIAVLLSNYNLAAYNTLTYGPNDLFLVLSDQEKIMAKASAAGVNFVVGGGEE